MKKIIYCASLLAFGACNTYAQSTVTLYGRVASGLDFVTNVATPNGQSKNNYRFGSDQYGYSWFGLTGDEDLGSGRARGLQTRKPFYCRKWSDSA